MRTLFLLFGILLFTFSCTAVRAESPALTPDSSVDDVLDALRDRGQDLKDFVAKVRLTATDETSGDSTTRIGQLVYQKKADENARIRITFTQLKQGDRITAKKQEYLLDKGHFIDRDYQKQLEVNRQVTRPGQKLDLFKLGEGPFPLPLGQDKAEVHKAFEVTKAAPAKNDPANSVHLVLTPKPDTKLARKFKTIDVWVDLKTHMPVRIATIDTQETTENTTDLDVTSVNGGVKDEEFTLPEVDNSWNRHDEPYAE